MCVCVSVNSQGWASDKGFSEALHPGEGEMLVFRLRPITFLKASLLRWKKMSNREERALLGSLGMNLCTCVLMVKFARPGAGLRFIRNGDLGPSQSSLSFPPWSSNWGHRGNCSFQTRMCSSICYGSLQDTWVLFCLQLLTLASIYTCNAHPFKEKVIQYLLYFMHSLKCKNKKIIRV